MKAAIAEQEESKRASSGKTILVLVIYLAWFINLTKDITDDPGENPKIVEDNEPHLPSQLKAGERVLTKAIRERNNLQDANIRLTVELKDVRAQLANSVKENKRLRRGIYSKCFK